MSKRGLIADNIALVAGVCLPILLVIIFWVATVIPKMTVADPVHDLIYSAEIYDYNQQVPGTVRLDVSDGRLRAVFHANDNQNYSNTPRLFYFDVDAGSTHELSIEIPADPLDGEVLEIPEAERYRLSKKSISPDGYSFDGSYSSRSGFFFFDSGYRYRGTIRKDGRALKIPVHGDSQHGNLRFLGWVIEGEPP